MNVNPLPQVAAVATLQDVLDRLSSDGGLSKTRKRDLRSAVTSFAKLRGQPPAAIRVDLPEIRRALDDRKPAWAKLSSKSQANVRSGLGAAIARSCLRPMLQMGGVDLDAAWGGLLARAEKRVRLGLSRFGRWASLRGTPPEAVHDDAMDRFVAELDSATLVRNLHLVRGKRCEVVECPCRARGLPGAAACCSAKQPTTTDPDLLAPTAGLVSRGC
jgi:hypothetical protein